VHLEYSASIRWDESQAICGDELRFQFSGRSVPDVDVSYVLGPVTSCGALGDIRWDGDDGLARVRGQPEALLARVIRRHPINLNQQIHRLLPNEERFETPKAHVFSP
jgi:hypothetical protein